ncbi:MAG: prephenate dehydrogenase/arogenate dehydrogenase family protein [Actinomycetota bacterium]|nr:prephenate dehydrogenase/arogenate dehydrogenase family protein [Actinomycetota bacterium]
MTSDLLVRARRELGRIAIVGAGQIGTMLGLALRDRGYSDVWLHDKDPAVAELSLGLGAANGALSSTRGALEYDSVIVALPVPEIVSTIEDLGPQMRPGTFVVDTGSAKAAITATMRTHIPPGVHAIGGHPMVGTERPGPQGARPELMTGAAFVFSEVREDQAALERARSLAALVGARMYVVDAQTHDECLARTSHIAHVAAYALASLNNQGHSAGAEGLSSPGYDRAIRLARSDVQMVAGFLTANAQHVKGALDELIWKLDEASRLLADASGEELAALLETWQGSTSEDLFVPAGRAGS